MSTNLNQIMLQMPAHYQPSSNCHGLAVYKERLYEYHSTSNENHYVSAMAINFLLSFGEGPQIRIKQKDTTPKYNYIEMKQNKSNLHKDLIEYLYHPSKVAKYLDTNDDIDEYLM